MVFYTSSIFYSVSVLFVFISWIHLACIYWVLRREWNGKHLYLTMLKISDDFINSKEILKIPTNGREVRNINWSIRTGLGQGITKNSTKDRCDKQSKTVKRRSIFLKNDNRRWGKKISQFFSSKKEKFSFNEVIKKIAIYVKRVVKFASTLAIKMYF